MPRRKKNDRNFRVDAINPKGRKNTALSQLLEHQMERELEKVERGIDLAIKKAIEEENIPSIRKLIKKDSINVIPKINIAVEQGLYKVDAAGKSTLVDNFRIGMHIPFEEYLKFAIIKGRSKAVDCLLEENEKCKSEGKASVEKLSELLVIAALQPNKAIITSLIRHKANPNPNPDSSVTGQISVGNEELDCKDSFALGVAIVIGNIAAVEALLPHVDIRKWRAKKEQSALFIALNYATSTPKMVNFLLQKKLVDIEAPDIFGITPLILASLRGREVANLLLKAGASDADFKRFNLSPLEHLSQKDIDLLRCSIKLKEHLKDLREKITEEKKKQELEIIEKQLAKFFGINEGDGSIYAEIRLSLPSTVLNLLNKKSKKVVQKTMEQSERIIFGTEQIVSLVQALQNNFMHDETHLRDKINQYLFSNYGETLRSRMNPLNKDIVLKDGSLLKVLFAKKCSLQDIQANIGKALKDHADGSRNFKVEEEIAKILYNLNGEGLISDEGDRISFFDQYNTVVDKFYLKKEEEGHQKFHLSMDIFLTTIKEIVVFYESEPKQDLAALVISRLRFNSTEGQALIHRATKDFQENLKMQAEQNLFALNQLMSAGSTKLEEEIATLETAIAHCAANSQCTENVQTVPNSHSSAVTATVKSLKFSNFIQKVTSEKEALIKASKDLREAYIRQAEYLKYYKEQVDAMTYTTSTSAAQNPNPAPYPTEEYRRNQDLHIALWHSSHFLGYVASLEERTKALNAAVAIIQPRIDKYAAHQAIATARASEQLAQNLEDACKTLEAELAKKVEESTKLEKLDALSAEKKQQKESFFAKLEFDRKNVEEAAELKNAKALKTEMLNTAISAATESEQPKKPHTLTFSAATDILPKLTVAVSLKPLRSVLDKTELISDTQLEPLKHFMIERSALLCLTARLMDGIKDYPETALFSVQQAEKIRNVIFHYRADIFNEPSISLIANDKTDIENLKIAKETNAGIREMVSSIIDFISDETAQKQCKGNWELINARLNSPVLNKILNYEEKPRNNLNIILLRLNKAEEQLKLFQSFRTAPWCKLDDDVIMPAIYSTYAEAGALAADYRRLNHKLYTRSIQNKLYDQYIEYGNDVRHGRIPNIAPSSASTSAFASTASTTAKTVLHKFY